MKYMILIIVSTFTLYCQNNIKVESYSIPWYNDINNRLHLYQTNKNNTLYSGKIDNIHYSKINESYIFKKYKVLKNLKKSAFQFDGCFFKIIIHRNNNVIDTVAFGDDTFKSFYYNGNFYEFDWKIFLMCLEFIPYDHKNIFFNSNYEAYVRYFLMSDE